MYPNLEATSNKFEQLHADSTAWTNYNQLPPQVGLWMYGDTVERNRFYLLANGAWFESGNTSLRLHVYQNAFLNCAKGLVMGDYRVGAGAGYPDGTAELSCNTYLRNDNASNRSGNVLGTYRALSNQATILNSNDITSGQALLKEYFASLNGSSAVVPIANAGSQPLQYYTFDNYRPGIQSACTLAVPGSGLGNVNVSMTSPGFPNTPNAAINSDPSVNTCNQDGFTDTGIQNRLSNVKPAKQSALLEQNALNPSSDETYISYRLPSTARHASLLVREGLTGREILRQSVDPTAREVRLNLQTLPNGLYFYTIEAEGVLAPTLRLLVNRQ